MIRYLGAVVLVTLGMFVHVILFNLRLSEIGFQEETMGRLGAAMSIGTALGTLIWGALASRWGLKPAICCALLGLSLALTGRALFSTPGALAADSFLTGFFLAGWFVTNSPAIADLAAAGKGATAFSMNVAFGIGVGAMGGLLAGVLPAILGSIQSAMLTSSVLVLCGLGFIAVTHFQGTASRRLTLRLSPPARAFVIRFLAAVALWYAFLAGFSPFFNIYLRSQIGASTVAIGGVFGVAQVVQAAAALSMAWVMARFGVVRSIVATQFLAAGCILLFLPLRVLPLAAAAYMAYGALQVMSEPGLQNFFMEGVPAAERPAASAVNLLTMFLVNAAVGLGAGTLISSYGYRALFVFLAALGAMAAFTFGVVLRLAPLAVRTDTVPDASAIDNPDSRLP